MSAETAKQALKAWGLEDQIITMADSTATVALAAQALNIEEDQIAKSLAFEEEDGCILVVASGSTRVQNGKFKRTFGLKAKMCSPQSAEKYTSHLPGGVCPFGCSDKTRIFLDKSLLKHQTVYPACGSSHNAIALSPEQLFKISKAIGWVDIGKDPAN